MRAMTGIRMWFRQSMWMLVVVKMKVEGKAVMGRKRWVARTVWKAAWKKSTEICSTQNRGWLGHRRQARKWLDRVIMSVLRFTMWGRGNDSIFRFRYSVHFNSENVMWRIDRWAITEFPYRTISASFHFSLKKRLKYTIHNINCSYISSRQPWFRLSGCSLCKSCVLVFFKWRCGLFCRMIGC